METWKIAAIVAGVVVVGAVGYAILSDDDSNTSSGDGSNYVPNPNTDLTGDVPPPALPAPVPESVVDVIEPQHEITGMPEVMETATELPSSEDTIEETVTAVAQQVTLDTTIEPIIDASLIQMTAAPVISEQYMANVEAYEGLVRTLKSNKARVLPTDRLEYFEKVPGEHSAVMLTRSSQGSMILYQVEFCNSPVRQYLYGHTTINPFTPLTSDDELTDLLLVFQEAACACGRSDEELAQLAAQVQQVQRTQQVGQRRKVRFERP